MFSQPDGESSGLDLILPVDFAEKVDPVPGEENAVAELRLPSGPMDRDVLRKGNRLVDDLPARRAWSFSWPGLTYDSMTIASPAMASKRQIS